jgi:hypothetical protein
VPGIGREASRPYFLRIHQPCFPDFRRFSWVKSLDEAQDSSVPHPGFSAKNKYVKEVTIQRWGAGASLVVGLRVRAGRAGSVGREKYLDKDNLTHYIYQKGLINQ